MYFRFYFWTRVCSLTFMCMCVFVYIFVNVCVRLYFCECLYFCAYVCSITFFPSVCMYFRLYFMFDYIYVHECACVFLLLF